MILPLNQIIQGDCLEVLKELPDESVDTIITSPPYYGLRDYGVEGQLGLEKTLNEYLEKMLLVTAELKRVLKKTGTMWWNHGDSYGGTGTGQKPDHKGKFTSGQFAAMTTDKITEMKNGFDYPAKSLLLQAHRLAIRMVDEQSWILRNTIIWHKPNVMPSSIKDRFTVDYEPIFFLSKSKNYYFKQQFDELEGNPKDKERQTRTGSANQKYALLHGNKPSSGGVGYSEEGRNKRTVWRINTKGYSEAHFATFPEELIEPMVMAGCPKDGIVLDPFMGAGTTAVVAKKLGRNYLGIELNPEYIKIAETRLSSVTPPML